MNDIDENIINKHLNNPPEFEYSEKPWVVAKSKLDYERKIKRFALWGFLLGFLLLGILALIGNYWYNKRFQDYKNTINTAEKTTIEKAQLITNIDTVYKEKIIYIHDTLYKTIKITKTISSPYDSRLGYINRNRLSSSIPIPGYNSNSIFSTNRSDIINNRIYGKASLPSGYSALSYSNPILNTKSNNSVSKKQVRINDFDLLLIKLNYLKYKRKIGYSDDYQYQKWLENLAKSVAKEKGTFKYKFNKFMTGFNPVGYEIEGQTGGAYSLTFKKSNIGIFTGLNGKVLFENGLKATIGINWVDYHGEFKAEDINPGDFPNVPNNGDIFDGIYMDNSYWLLPIGIEYHINHNKAIHPYFGIGWAMKFGVEDVIKYEFHDIDTYKEYITNKSIDESMSFKNYWIKTGMEFNWNKKFSNSFELSYYVSNKKYEFNFSKLNYLVLNLNTKYRF